MRITRGLARTYSNSTIRNRRPTLRAPLACSLPGSNMPRPISVPPHLSPLPIANGLARESTEHGEPRAKIWPEGKRSKGAEEDSETVDNSARSTIAGKGGKRSSEAVGVIDGNSGSWMRWNARGPL